MVITLLAVLAIMATGRSGPLPVEGSEGLATAMSELCPMGLILGFHCGKQPRHFNKDPGLGAKWVNFATVQALMMPHRLGLPNNEACITIASMM